MLEPPRMFPKRKIDVGIGTGRNDVEFGIKNIDPVKYPTKARHGEGFVALVLADRFFASTDLLTRAGDDEVRRVHGDQIGGELRREMVARLIFPPISSREE